MNHPKFVEIRKWIIVTASTRRLNRKSHKEESYRRFSLIYIFGLTHLASENNIPLLCNNINASHHTSLAKWALTGAISRKVLLNTIHSVETRGQPSSGHSVPVVKHPENLGAKSLKEKETLATIYETLRNQSSTRLHSNVLWILSLADHSITQKDHLQEGTSSTHGDAIVKQLL